MNEKVHFDWNIEGNKLMKPIEGSPRHWSWPIIKAFKSKDDLFWYNLYISLKAL